MLHQCRKLCPIILQNPFIKMLIKGGAVKVSIDWSFSSEKIADAHRDVEAGQMKGNWIIAAAFVRGRVTLFGNKVERYIVVPVG